MSDIEMVPGKGNPGGLMIILDFPQPSLFKQKKHMWPEEKRLLEATIAGMGFNPRQIYTTFAVKELVPQVKGKSGKPTPDQLHTAYPILVKEMRDVAPTRILVCGGTGYAVLHGLDAPVNIRNYHGLGVDMPVGQEGQSVYTVFTSPPYFVVNTPALFRDFAKDIEKLSIGAGHIPMPKLQKIVCKTALDVHNGLATMYGSGAVSCDTETDGLHPWENQIEAIGFGCLYRKGGMFNTENYDGRTVVIPWDLLQDEQVKASIQAFLLDPQGNRRGPTVFHNAKFDIQFLSKYLGVSLLDMNVRDTLLMNYLLDERPIASAVSPHGLKNLSRVRYDAPAYKFDFDVFWSKPKEQRDWTALYDYLGLDLYYTAKLYWDLLPELKIESDKFIGILDNILMPATKALAEIEMRGVKLDRKYLEELRDQLIARKAEIVEEIGELLDDTPLMDSIPADFAENLNIGSPQQVSKLLYVYLGLPKTGDLSTDRASLDTLIYRLEHDELKMPNKEYLVQVMELIIEYRETGKILGTYAEGLLERLDADDRIHGQFNLAGTGTGRLSSSDPNLQNQPQAKGLMIRRAFVPSPGRKWLKVDYSNLEYRIAALVSQDPKMIAAFGNHRDIHREVASAALGIPPETVNKMQRYAAKFIGFGILYGRGPASIADGPEMRGYNWTVRDAARFIDTFLSQFVGLREWMNNQKKKVIKEQELETAVGRKRRWPYLNTREALDAQRQALNFPIQSTASDFTLTALIELHSMFIRHKMDVRILLTVHDEIDFDVPEDELDFAAQLIKDTMANIRPVPCNVLIEVEAEVGSSWGTLEPWVPKSG